MTSTAQPAADAGNGTALARRTSPLLHWALALYAISAREIGKFIRQRGRWASALIRPILWLVVFAAGIGSLLGISIVPPYKTYVTYQEYIMPGLLGIVLLFYGMQSSLSMVYDREMGMMRLLLTAPVPRSFLLLAKLVAGTLLSVLQAVAFLIIALLMGVDLPLAGCFQALPALVLSGMMLGALGLLLSVHVKQLENFAGTMNFVIFPMFFISPALYPLWKLEESGAEWLHTAARFNPFSHAVELVRFALYGQIEWTSLSVVGVSLLLFFALAVRGYDPQRGLIRQHN